MQTDIENSIEFCRLCLRLALGDPHSLTPARIGSVLEATGSEWNRRIAYLLGCGLARPVFEGLDRPAPGSDALKQLFEQTEIAARRDNLRKLVQKGALRRLDSTLAEAGGEGVVLKGGSAIALETSDANLAPIRATRLDQFSAKHCWQRRLQRFFASNNCGPLWLSR